MKTTNANNIGAQSCSCTSCTYRSEADRPSLRRIISQGTRIDRLYYGKYIPLREKKLLEKLVRTRGVYDDIRAQLISNSTISLESKAVLKPPVKVSPKKLKNRQYSKEILKLVDLVDRGEKLESKELSVCCSCCTCSSKYDDHYKHIDKQRLKRTYHGGHRHRYIKDKIGDYRKRAVRFKTKHIKSDPCTCTFKFSGMLKHLSKGTPKILDYNPVPFTDFKPTFDDEINQSLQKNSYLSFISNENLRNSKTHIKEMMLEGIRKISETKLKIGEKLDLQEKKSLEKINKLKNNIKSKLKDHKVKKNNSGTICKCPENNLLSHIKKDSISKFKDDLKRKKILKNWECYPECVEDICIPEECFVKLKQKRSRCKSNECNLIVPPLIKPTIKIQSKQEDATILNKKNKQSLRLRAQQTFVKANPWRRFIGEKETITKTENEDFKTEDLKKNAFMPGIAITNKTKTKNLNIGPPRENTSRQKIVRIGSSFNFNIEFSKNKGEPQSKQSLIKYDHRHKKRRKIHNNEHRRQQGSQIKFTMTNTKTGEDNSKSCSSFCPRKLKPKKRKPKSIIGTNKSTITKESLLTFNVANDNVERNTYYTHQEIIKLQKNGQKRFHKKQILLPYECEPNICIPDICDPYKCIKLINARNTKIKEQSVFCQCDSVATLSQTGRPKSISSSTSTPHPTLKTKFVNSKTMYKSKRNKLNKIKNRKIIMNQSSDSKTDRQVVRIGSNISFNLEFYKTKHPYHISSPNLKILSNGINVKSNKKSGNQKVLRDKSTIPINNNLYKKAGIGSTLKRCFCTLKLQEKKKIKRKKMVTIGTNIINDLYTNAIVTYNKSTKTKKDLPLNYFECEPFVCIPGSCDPYECLDRINRKPLKEVGSVTEHPEKISVSSSTYLNKSLRAIQIQSKPQSKDRKTSAKTKTNTSEIKEYLTRGSSNQAVKIGSSFSFDIQFFKTNIPTKQISSKPHIEQKTKIRTRIKKVGKTEKNSKFNVANVTTQSQQKDKTNKSTMPGHLIKRCFCTLNLQKNSINQNGKEQKILTTSMFPREYTINRATTKLNPILICQKHLSDSSKHSCKKINSIIGSSPIHIQSTQRKESLMVVEKQSQCYSLSHIGDDKWESSLSFIEERLVSLNQRKITNLSQYIKQNFCTMNLQLINKNVYEKNQKSSISTSNGRVKEFLKGNKSSVRLGSNFSFDISFSKHLPSSKYSSNAELYKPVKDNSKKVKNIGTIKNYNTNFDRQSQSTSNKVIHKGSAAMPITKRCFCTLKLHKKGRTAMKNNKKQVNMKYVSKIPNNTISRGQNTDFKPMKITHSLLPYECEPNICIPGHCDPYKCLEIMKRRRKGNALLPYECEPNICIPGQCDPYQCLEIIKRRNKITKESGIVTVQSTKSASSITTDNHSIGTQKSHQLKMKTKENSVKLSPNAFGSKSDVVQPSQQVVRIGSNFSFNIEFFKDQGSPPIIQKTTKDFKEIKQRNQRKIITEKGISTPRESKLRRHKVTEIEKSPNRIASTMTSSFLKRCFCTAQLRKDSKAAFLKRCFCLIKSKKPSTGNNEGIHISKVQHVDKKINTKNVKPKRYQLAPYECEPGICIPGQCDPYECEKIMRKRTKSKLSSTAEFKDSRSVSIDSQKLPTKNAKIQFKNREKIKAIKTRDLPRSSLIHSDRQMVRIGSNFSFNIEFYKNKPSRYLMNLPSNQQKDVIRKRLKNQQSEVIATRTKRSQVDPINKMDRSTEQKHFLKRCFCTLQLHNQNSNIPKEKNEKKKANKDIKIRNKSVMTNEPKLPQINLQDYECPPGICIPNQCDPYECERIIKMRRMQQYKEFGMSTKSPKKSNIGSTTRSLKKYKQTTQTRGNKKYHKNTNFKPKEVSTLNSNSIQRVKIGSSFNFNIEFYKNKNNHGLEISKKPKPTRKYQTKRKFSNAKTQIQKQVKFAKIGDKKSKSQSTMINTSPTLKRCFCTLFMKSAKGKRKIKKQTTSSIGTETQKPFVPPTSTLLPYECEPLTCIPGECDPVKCLERIMKRNKNFGGNTNFSQSKSSAGTMTPGKAKFKTQKSQFKALSKGEFPTKNKSKKGQVVRIGSNFNFNIEFYKNNNAPNETNDYVRNAKFIRNHTRVHSGIPKKDYKQNHPKKSFHNAESQLQKKACDVSTCPQLKTMLKEKQTNVKNNRPSTFLKRCFCTLKLQKLRNRSKNAATSFDREIKKQELPPPPKQNFAIEQKLLPYECEPNVCIPGQCDPYECEKRIKARELCIRNKCDKKCYMTQTSQNICTQIKNPCSNKCIGVRPVEYKIRKQQSSLTRSVTTKRTVNEPRYATNLNNQAVKVGSNFSFNIEFYKKGTPIKSPIALERNERKSSIENVQDKNIITKSAFRRNHGSQAMAISSQDKTLGVQNELNRCFCTLKLQKNRLNRIGKNNLNFSNKPPPYPQTFEVRRLSFQPNTKIATKYKHPPVKSVSTRINEKYLKNNQIFCPCRDTINTTEMETILPFAPNKFKDTTSKTFIPVQNESKREGRSDTKQGLKLNKKKSKRHLNHNKQLLKDHEKSIPSRVGSVSNFKEFLCRCAGVFSRKEKTNNVMNTTNDSKNNRENENNTYIIEPKPSCEYKCLENLRSSKSDRRPVGQIVNQNTKVRKSKSLKLDNEKRNNGKKNIKESNKVNKNSKYANGPEADNTGISVSINQNKKNDGVLCSNCKIIIEKNKTSPPKVHFDDKTLKIDSLDETKGIKKTLKSVIKKQKKDANEKCASCNSCGGRLNKEELQKAAGDRLIDIEKIMNPLKMKDLFNKHIRHKDNKNTSEQKELSPLFEMKLNRRDYDIINKEEVIDKVTKLSKVSVKDKPKLTKPHDKSCSCCICRPKKVKKVDLKKPCTCGSFICSKRSEKMRKDSLKRKYPKLRKPCVCGSPICDRETEAMRDLSSHRRKVTCICQKEREKRERELEKQRAIIRKKRREEDSIRRKYRKKRDKDMEKRINKDSSDVILAAESLIDIGKLGITACADILRSIARITTDPKQAYMTLKSMKEDPELIASTMQTAFADSGVASTARRVRLRCMSMRGVKKIKNCLEQYPVTNFLLHIADKDPKQRIPKKAARVRERLDFGCSLYMASLRKRPFLSVYDRWPWFYPHFLALLNVYRQFRDILLFLLAVVVWSPCIFCMEACRAIMCCFFCTG
ncbi:uncharacterized protein LOC124530297 [Vanessa cardui]|uniref:uncharacterized protein LOC124530297 n=1 Tax=Vanessa cardui TaxID=171605 RepID=UPI001F137973|nr:uncharacterized protein LOC124530297 [Vanessa cardui]